MNKKLENLYNQYWNDLLANVDVNNAAHPLLIKVDKKYEEADIKIMIVGQETNGWSGSLEENKKSIEYLTDDYYHYFYDIYADKNKLTERLTKKRKKPFWSRSNFKFFKEELEKNLSNQKLSFVWNNVSKIGKTKKGKPTQKIQELEEKYFNGVFKKEIEILKPNIIIFVTGNRNIPIAHKPIKSVKENAIEEIVFDEFPNILAFRTYHPNAKLKGIEKTFKNQVLELILNRVNLQVSHLRTLDKGLIEVDKRAF